MDCPQEAGPRSPAPPWGTETRVLCDKFLQVWKLRWHRVIGGCYVSFEVCAGNVDIEGDPGERSERDRGAGEVVSGSRSIPGNLKHCVSRSRVAKAILMRPRGKRGPWSRGLEERRPLLPGCLLFVV